MELLAVTLAQANPAMEVEALARLRLISNTVRNAAGLSNARFYCSGEPENYYLLLTTWENVEWWQKAQERHSPYRLVQESPVGIFRAPPDQWLMQYLWGYSRPQAKPVVAAAHLAVIRSEQVERVQKSWLESLQQQAIEPILSFALLARGREEEQPATRRPGATGLMFLNLLSWPGETYREDFYADESYQSLHHQLSDAGMLRILKLDPV
jgi:hypothetical protein